MNASRYSIPKHQYEKLKYEWIGRLCLVLSKSYPGGNETRAIPTAWVKDFETFADNFARVVLDAAHEEVPVERGGVEVRS